jgi:hypothetical protein
MSSIKIWQVTDSEGETNRIIACEEFVQEHYEQYEVFSEYYQYDKLKAWRNSELERTDELSRLSDLPNLQLLLDYRQDLRDWPQNAELWPHTRPDSFEQRVRALEETP